MPVGVDIIVRGSDSTDVTLVVEAKIRVRDLDMVEAELRNAMLRLSCPVGLLVTPEKLWIYVDHFTSTDVSSVQRIGEFEIANQLRRAGPGPGDKHFETVVQRWLENLPRTTASERVTDAKLWDALNRYVLPAIETGNVRAAAPRY